MREAILSLDIGSTVVKAVLFDLAGQELVVAEQAVRLNTPQPGWAELETEELWQAVVQVMHSVRSGRDPAEHILAVALASQSGSLIPAKADGTPVGRVITWMDRRSEEIVASWQATGIAERVRRISGWSPQAGLPLPSICWLHRAHPDRFATARRFLSVNDYVGHKLSGAFATNPSMAGEMLLADLATGEWSATLCELAEIQPEQLSPIVTSDAIIGKLGRDVGRLTGLEAGIPVIAGGQDHSCEALALGMTSAGSLLLACGTAWVLNSVAETCAVDEVPPAMDLNAHAVPHLWIASQYLGGFGADLDWWLNQCRQEVVPPGLSSGGARYASFNASLRETVAGSPGPLFCPASSGRRVAGIARSGGFFGLRLDLGRADLGRAVLEGAAFEVRWALEEIWRMGLPVGQMWMLGGATRSPVWPKIVADVTGVPLALTQYRHSAALGAALLAGGGLGLFDQLPFWISVQQIDPNSAHAPVYEERFAAYQRIFMEPYR